MALQYESNTSLAFDTDVFRECGKKYAEIAGAMRNYATNLDKILSDLASAGWSTPAGEAFYEMTKINWSADIEKYAALLNTLQSILNDAARRYDSLVANNIETLRLT